MLALITNPSSGGIVMTDPNPVQVTLVTARGCHFCQDARQVLAEFGKCWPLTVEEIPAGSPVGQALVLEHGSGMYPLVLVDGAFFSAGRLPRRKLVRQLAGRRSAVAAAR